MKKVQRLLAVAFCALVMAVVVRTSLVKAHSVLPPKQEDAMPAEPRPLIPLGSDPLLLLQSPDAEQRDNAGIYLVRHQEDTEDKVQAIAEAFLKQSAERKAKNPNDLSNIEGNQDDFGAKDAIGLLGALRSTRSVPFLVDHLASLHVFIRHPVGLGGAYPCAGALVSIGSPALNSLLVNVAQTEDAQTIRLTAYVFVRVLGKNVANAFVEDRRSRFTAPAARHRLDALEHTI